MNINRHVIHLLLCDYDSLYKQYSRFFDWKPAIISSLEKVRRDLNLHKEEGYENFYKNIDDSEMDYFLDSLMTFVEVNTYESSESIVIHKFMTQHLMIYELDYPNKMDKFRQIIDTYFHRLNAKYKFTTDMNSLNIWLAHLINNPKNYISQFLVHGFGNSYNLDILNLSECGCTDISHDRLLSDVRTDVENKIISSCVDGIKLLSLGAGKGFQEFILLNKLLSKGIFNIELCLVEHDYRDLLDIKKSIVNIYDETYNEEMPIPKKYYDSVQKNVYDIIRAVSLLSKIYPESQLTISQYSDVKHIDKTKIFDLVYAIDFDNNDLTDFNYLAKHMHSDSKAILSKHYQICEYIKKNDQMVSVNETNYPVIQMENNCYKLKRTLKQSLQ